MHKVMFAGPSLGVGTNVMMAQKNGFEVRAPAARGDVEELLREGGNPGVLVVVDGRFHQSLALGHAELRAAIDGGWSVWGLSSMGAIRAYEMRTLGMRGFGTVYAHFLADDDFQDDEVAMLHAPAHPYTATTEPLVHLRHAVADMLIAGELKSDEAQNIVDDLKSEWYGFRNLETFTQAVARLGGAAAGRGAQLRASAFDPFRVKVADLSAFLRLRPWLTGSADARPIPAPFSRTTRPELL
jgi:hypothetical protein